MSRIAGDDIKEKLAAFEQDIDKFSPDEQARLWEGLGNVYQRLQDFPNVKRCFKKLVDRKPDELYPWENMFNLALTYPRDEDAQKTAREAAERIRELAGATSAIYKYCVASQLIAQVIRDQTKVQTAEKGKELGAERVAKINQEDHKKLADASKLVDDAMSPGTIGINSINWRVRLMTWKVASIRRLPIINAPRNWARPTRTPLVNWCSCSGSEAACRTCRPR